MAGAGYKLFNTGDVLTAAQVNTYLMEQTVMVFADAAARTAALSGVVSEGMISYLKDTNAVEVYNGSAWVASDDPNAIQNTIVDAKGDLITATAADTPARLAVGNNGETLVADSSASTGLRWQGNFAAGKNAVINGDFRIWQRGTTFNAIANGAYTADRFYHNGDGSGFTKNISRQTFTPGTAPVAGYEGAFFYRFNQSVAGTGSSYTNFAIQAIEDVRVFAGQTVTLSFWVKADASRAINIAVGQIFDSASSNVFKYPTGITATTSWQRHTVTFSLDSISGKTIGTNSSLLLILSCPNNTVQTIDLWGLQLEAGNTATAFQTATGTLAGELQAAQRYYYRLTGVSGGTSPLGVGISSSTTTALVTIPNPVQMRITPTALDYSSVAVTNCTTYTNTASNLILEAANPHVVRLTATATGQTSNQPVNLLANANGYIGLSAEL